MWTDLGLALVAFALTTAEEALAARRTQAITGKHPIQAANWSAIFDAVLFLDVYLIIGHWWLVGPIVAGSWLGCWWAVRTRPRPRKRRVRRKRPIRHARAR